VPFLPLQVAAFQVSEAPLVPAAVSGSSTLARAPETVQYRFLVPSYVTSFGQELRVVGSLEALGGWNPAKVRTVATTVKRLERSRTAASKPKQRI
jgi:hypothetical protein